MAGAKGVWNIAGFAEQYGPLFKMQLLGSVVVVLSDPQTISRVARKTGKNRQLSWSYRYVTLHAPLSKEWEPQLSCIYHCSQHWEALYAVNQEGRCALAVTALAVNLDITGLCMQPFKMQLLGSVVVVLSEPQTSSRVARKTDKKSFRVHLTLFSAVKVFTNKACVTLNGAV
jgi:cytochrome P450